MLKMAKGNIYKFGRTGILLGSLLLMLFNPASADWTVRGGYNWSVNAFIGTQISGCSPGVEISGKDSFNQGGFATKAACQAALPPFQALIDNARTVYDANKTSCGFCACWTYFNGGVSCSGSDDLPPWGGMDPTDLGGISARTVSFLNNQGAINLLGPESGLPFFSQRPSGDFESWMGDAEASWRAYLIRNAAAKDGVTIWPGDEQSSGALEWFYRKFGGVSDKGHSNKGVANTPPPVSIYRPLVDSGGTSEAMVQVENSFQLGDTPDLLRGSDKTQELVAESPVTGDKKIEEKECGPGGSVGTSYAVSYHSTLRGRSESTGISLEPLPDSRVIFTDEGGVRWTFRAYSGYTPASGVDIYYRTPLGCPYRVLYVKTGVPAGPGGRGFRVESPDGAAYEFSPGSDGVWRPARLNASDGSWLTYARDPSGRVLKITDMHGRPMEFTYNKDGRTASVSSPGGKKLELSYDAAGNMTEAKRQTGVKNVYTYDSRGMVTAFKSGSLAEERYAYDETGRILTSESEGGVNRVENFYYDASSKTVISDAFNNRTSYAYKTVDGRRLTIAATDALGGVSLFDYDENYNIFGSHGRAGPPSPL